MNRKLYILLAVLVLASMVLSACGGAGGTAAVKKVTVSYSQEPDNVRLEYSNMTYAAWLDQIVDASLLTWDENDQLVAELAADVPSAANGGVSADGLTITFHLKPGLKWSDGQPLTSKDVLFTWQSQEDPKNAPISRAGWDQISGIDTPDDTTAVVHFKQLYAPWYTLFAVGAQGASGGLLPAHVLQGKTGLEKDPEIHSPTVVAGPFMIKEWVAGDHMALVPNPDWSGSKPKLGEVDIKFVPDPETALAALKTGDVDFNPDFTESDIPTIKALEPKVHVLVGQTPSFEHLFFNLGITNSTIKDASGNVIGNSDVAGFCPFQDANVRKAFILATDRETIAKTLLYGAVSVPASLWPNSPWYDTKLTPYPYDPDQANQLLDAAGYAKGADGIRAGTCNGQPVKFSIGVETTNKQVRIDTMNALHDMYQKIGVELKPNPLPAGTFFGDYSSGADLMTGKFDMGIYTTGFYPDPDPGYTFSCAGVPSQSNQSGQNDYHYCDQSGQMDKLVAAGIASADPATRKAAYNAIQEYQYNQVLFIPLYARANVSGYTDRLILPKMGANSYWGYGITQWDVK
ncbi:MAG TPA: peptide ABC transporter substrate-binding protein [Anaerolineales bacterium]|nr:peptide ABC transporter substrate-binding protein [Anaerolineales bacterium]